jgi:GNAT superfamily N-acetyltransferase
VADVPEVLIREATTDDVGGMAASSAGLFAEDAGTRDRLRNQDWPRLHGEEWVRGLIDDDSLLALVAVDGDVCVGHLAGAFYAPSPMWLVPRAELVSMRVADSHRGRGVGADLVAAFVAWARAKGAVRLQVDAYAANEGALRFYQRSGFTPHSIELVQDL